MANYPILNKANEAKAVGAGPVIEYKLSPEELAKYRDEKVEKQEEEKVDESAQPSKQKQKYNITKEFLEAELATGKSIMQIEREQSMRPGTLYYYVKKFGIETNRKKRKPAEASQQQEMEPEKPVENQPAEPDQTPEQASQDDIINRPAHYLVGGIETIDFIRAKLTAEQFEGYLLGNTLKYLSRYRHKNGLEDLRKAGWYLTRLIAEMGGDTKWTD